MEKGLRMSCPMAAMAVPLLLVVVILQLPVQGFAAGPPPGSDARSLTVIFSNYIATTDGSLSDRKKSCVVSVGLSYPRGWVVAVASVTLRGYAMLEAGTSGSIQTWYYFSGYPKTARVTRKIPAPFHGKNFEFTDNLLTTVYSKCGVVRNLNLASEAKVHPGSSNRKAIINIDSKDFALGQQWRLVWERC